MDAYDPEDRHAPGDALAPEPAPRRRRLRKGVIALALTAMATLRRRNRPGADRHADADAELGHRRQPERRRDASGRAHLPGVRPSPVQCRRFGIAAGRGRSGADLPVGRPELPTP